jgi:ABC-2 type transport system permease protein
MQNIWLVIKHEIRVTLRKRSFWILSFVVPILLLGFQGYAILQDNDISLTDESTEEVEEESASVDMTIVGLVDESGLIRDIPSGIPPGMFVTLANRDDAFTTLEQGEIDQFVVIPEDYLVSGEVFVYDTEFQLLVEGDSGVAFGSSNEWTLPYLINFNLIRDEELFTVAFNPTPGNLATYHALNPPDESSESDQALAEFTSSAIPYIYYFILIVVSGYILQSVISEKENRTVEVLLVSLQPKELITGKLLGMSAVALLQLAFWATGAIFIANRGAQFIDISGLEFTPAFIITAVLFLVLGYLLYASVMAAAGALSNTAREAGQVTWILILPLLPTLMFGRLFAEDTDNIMVIFLSLFPFSAPSAMVTRMAVGTVPAWQVLLSLILTAITVYVVLSLATRFFHPQNLLSRAEFSWRRFATAWRDR